MAVFAYKAIARSGKEVSGQTLAATKDELAAKLKEDGLYLVACKEAGEDATPDEAALSPLARFRWLRRLFPSRQAGLRPDTEHRSIRGGIKAKTLSSITWQMSIGLKSGITLSEILDTIAKETRDGKTGFIFNFFYGRVTSGHTLSDSLTFFPDVFSPIYINMVRAGEAGGFLPRSLEEIATYLKKQDRLNKKIKSMMIYPVMLTLIAVATIIFMATFILPIFVQVFTEMNAELPTLTKVLLFCFGVFRDYVYLWLAALLLLLFFGRKLYKMIGSNLAVDRLALKIPLIGELLLKISISRFLGTLSVLLKTNVSILDSLMIGKAVAGNTALALEIDAIYKAVQSGKPMAEKMARSRYFPAMVTMMVSNGEKSGNLPEALEKVTEYYVEEVDTTISDTLAILEPMVVVVMGLFVAFVASGFLMPLFDLPGYIE